MRLPLLVLLVVLAVVVVSGQEPARRKEARARIRALADAARNGDTSAKQILQSRRRNRPRQRVQTEQQTELPVVPEEPQFENAEPAPVEETPRPRVKIPVRRTRVRIPRPVAQEPTTFRPISLVFTPTLSPVKVTPEPNVDPITEAPVFEHFPDELPTEAPVFNNAIDQTQATARPRLRIKSPQRTPVTQQPQQSISAFEQPQQPLSAFEQPQQTISPSQETPRTISPFQQPRQINSFQHPRQINSFQQPQQIKSFPKPQRTKSLFQQNQESDFDLEPHRALTPGLEVDSRSEPIFQRAGVDRTTKPTVETINRYAYYDKEGNYVFGYEAADGSFKEEKRGLDCIVTGKYGYVDPEGVRREFSYTSGNRCDPNAVIDPDNGEAPRLEPNDQFLQQTVEQPLTEEELSQIQFSHRRRPVNQPQPQEQRPQRQPVRQQVQPVRQQVQPVRQQVQQQLQPVQQQVRQQIQPVRQQVQQTFVSDNRRRQQQSQTALQPVPQQTQDFLEPDTVTPAPSRRFTTPASFNQFKASSFQEPHRNVAQDSVQQVAEPTLSPHFVDQRIHPAIINTPSPQRFTDRPTPKPVAFDFDKEFRNLFSNFGVTQQSSRAPSFKAVTQRLTPTTPAPTFRPTPPPTFRPAPLPTPTFPTRASPSATTRPLSLDDGSTTLGDEGAHQLVFDAASGIFKTVRVQAPNHFGVSNTARNPSLSAAPNHFGVSTPGQNPFLSATAAPNHFSVPTPGQNPFLSATAAPNHFSVPTPGQNPFLSAAASPVASTGRPLPGLNKRFGFNPLPPVPTGGLVINQPGRSPATDEFDKFFNQFNL
nr:DNA translocase FtsK-like [Procambarus clarkii]